MQALSIGWHGESFARTKSLKPLAKYLERPEPEQQKRDREARKLIAMLDELEKRGPS